MEIHVDDLDFNIQKMQYGGRENFLISIVSAIVMFFCLFGVLSFFIFNIIFIATPVVGSSMQPLLNFTGEYDDRDTVYINRFATYEKGDVIVINRAKDDYLVKRLIATEGDFISFVEENNNIWLYLNGKKLEEPYLFDYQSESGNAGMSHTKQMFTLIKSSAEWKKYFIGDTLVIPRGHVFVLGDNRGVSKDSSFYGPFAVSQIVGKVEHIVRYNESKLNYFLSRLFEI